MSNLMEVILCLRRVQLSPTIYMDIQQSYPINIIKLKTHSVSAALGLY